MRPILKYRGGKSKEITFFREYIPEHIEGTYIEPFFGGGSVYFYLEPEEAIINDINVNLMNFYIGIKDNYPEIREELDELQAIYERNRREFEALKEQHPDERVVDHNEDLYYRIRDMYNNRIEPEYSFPVIYYFINKTAYAGMLRFNARGEYNVPYGRYKNFNTQIITERHHMLLQNTEIFAGDYQHIFNMATPEDFMFLDPPYDTIFSDYGNQEYMVGGFTEEDQINLAQHVRALPCRFLMIIGRTDLTENLYADLIRGRYGKRYAVNIRNRFHSEAEHLIITNYNL